MNSLYLSSVPGSGLSIRLEDGRNEVILSEMTSRTFFQTLYCDVKEILRIHIGSRKSEQCVDGMPLKYSNLTKFHLRIIIEETKGETSGMDQLYIPE